VGLIAYVSSGYRCLKIFDVYYPQNPILIGSYSAPNRSAYSVTIVGMTAYVTIPNLGLQIIDVSKPQSPELIGYYYSSSIGYSPFVVMGKTAYLACLEAGLRIFDVSNPQNPVLIGSIFPNQSGSFYTCTIQGDKLCVADNGWNEIRIYDLTIPQSPELIQTYAWNLSTTDLHINGNTLYTANGQHGFNVHNLNAVDITDEVVVPVPQPELDIFPNPFKADTKFAVSLPKADWVKLSLYNLKGQLVRELCDGFKAQGQHSFSWDGKDNNGKEVPMGIYLVRFDNDKHKLLKKVTRF